MKLAKMSLVTAIAIASLSTVSFAETKVSGSTDFRWISWSKGDVSENESTRERINLDVKSASKDGKGSVNLQLRTASGTVGTSKAYADYMLGSVNLGIGPKIEFPGNFSFSTVRGVTASTKVAGFTLGVGIADADSGWESSEKSIITAKGKVAIADLRFDYRLGADKNDYLATDVKAKVGPATIIGAYTAGMGDNNKDMSLLGADVSVGLGTVTVYGAFSLSGDKGGQVTELSDSSNALGNIAGAWGTKATSTARAIPSLISVEPVANVGKVTALKFGAKMTVDDVTIHAYYSMATPDGGDASSKMYVDSKRNLNTQSSINIRYYVDSTGITGDDDEKSTIEFRFASKF